LIFEYFHTCPHCNEESILVEIETRYTSDLTRTDLFGELRELAYLDDDGHIKTTYGKAYQKINVHINPRLQDSKVNHVLKIEQNPKPDNEHDLWVICPNCGKRFEIYPDIPDRVAVFNQPYQLEVVPLSILPKGSIIYSDRPEETSKGLEEWL